MGRCKISENQPEYVSNTETENLEVNTEQR